jgi:NAD+ diphosphatase
MDRKSIYTAYVPAIVCTDAEPLPGYWFVFCGGRVLLRSGEKGPDIPLLAGPSEIGLKPERTQYLGTLNGLPCYSAELAPDVPAPPGTSFSDLRALYDVLSEDLYLLAGRALQIVAWDQTHQYCGRCGTRTEDLPGERAKKCPGCGFISYPRLSPAVITAVVRDGQILLVRYAGRRGNMHTVIAGFVEPGETLEECVKREVLEETGITVRKPVYFGSQPWPFPNSLMIGFTAEYESGEVHADGKEVAAAAWFSAGELPEIPPRWTIARDLIDWFAEKHRRP